jgi:hypothetical protein
MEPLRFFVDVAQRAFVSSPATDLRASSPAVFENDIENVELYFLTPATAADRLYDYISLTGVTVEVAIGITSPAALATFSTSITPGLTIGVTTLTTGGGGANEVQKITFSRAPVAGSWAIQFPTRNVSVSSLSSSVFTAANHGLYDGQSVTLTAFSGITTGSVLNGDTVYIVDRTASTLSVAKTPGGPAATITGSGTGTIQVAALTTGQLAFDATAAEVEAAIEAMGFSVDDIAQVIVTGGGTEFVLNFDNGSANCDYPACTVVATTLVGPQGVGGTLNLTGVTSLVGQSGVTLEIQLTEGSYRRTISTPASVSSDIISP